MQERDFCEIPLNRSMPAARISLKKRPVANRFTLVLHDRAKWIVLGSTSSSLPNRCLFHYGLSSEMKTDKI